MRGAGRAILLAAACTLVVLLGACGRDGGTVEATGGSGAPGRPDAAVAPLATDPPRPADRLEWEADNTTVTRIRPTTMALGTAVFWERFEVRMERATFTPSGYGDSGVLLVQATFVNRSLDRAMLDLADVALEQGDERLPAGLSKVPIVEAGATRDGTLGFWLPDGFDRTVATIAFGAADTNQSVVPLGRPAETVTIAPQPIEVRGSGEAADVGISVTGGHITPSYRPAERGLGRLRLSFDISYDGNDPLGLVVDSTDFVLILPDATEVPGAAVESDDLALEIVPGRGELTGQEVTFVVPLPVTGRYLVRYTTPTGDDDTTITLRIG